jgi:hypothetical protein
LAGRKPHTHNARFPSEKIKKTVHASEPRIPEDMTAQLDHDFSLCWQVSKQSQGLGLDGKQNDLSSRLVY